MTAPTPMTFTYDAERSVMVPLSKSRADRTYVDREMYRLGVIEERSAKSHAHYFAMLNEAWSNLPEHLAERYPSVEHLRKRALIEAGYFDERTFILENVKSADRLAEFLREMDEFSLVELSGRIVRLRRAQSQSYRAMGKATFADSKQRVLGIVSEMIGTSSAELQKHAGRAA